MLSSVKPVKFINKMNITLTSLEALILKATHESLPCPDAAAMEAFCAVMRDATDGPQFASQALAARIHSLNAREALLALTMLDRCMRRCDASFHSEVGKFRFLNEMIKLVSPKYFADRTSPEVRTRVLQLLHAWAIEYPKETKFKVAYEMLKNQGVIKETPPPLPPEDVGAPPRARPKNAIFEDEEKSKLLQKLLQSKKPEDLQHANRLIKTMVREEERLNEASSRRALEVSSAMDSAGLLRDMLDHAADASPDEEQLIHDLYRSCTSFRYVLQKMAAAETQQGPLDDILHVNDLIDDVFKKYEAFVSEKKVKSKSPRANKEVANGGDSLLDFAGAAANINNKTRATDRFKGNALDDLGDIFCSKTGESNIEPLKPVSLMAHEDIDLLGEKTTKTEGWNELDSLGEQLLKQSLPDHARRLDGFNSKSTKKIPMNALEKPALTANEAPSLTVANGAMLDLDFFTKTLDDRPATSSPIKVHTSDDVMVDISIDNTAKSNQDIIQLKKTLEATDCDVVKNNEAASDAVKTEDFGRSNKSVRSSDVKPLTDLDVRLESVSPSKLPPLPAFEELGGLSVVLHFCLDKPRPDVSVIVVSTTSRHTFPIEDYKFQAVVSKGCKVRLLGASGSELPACAPFRPPPALTQVMLVARPASTRDVALKFIITYTCQEEVCSEMGEIKHLPLDDIY